MNDLIERQEAIEAIEEMQMPIMRYMFPEEQFVFKGMSEALSAIKDLPSAQPEIEERTEEFAQNVPKEDLISRNVAIDAECEVCQIAPKKERGHNCTYYVHGCKEIECLRELPSAEPEPLSDAYMNAVWTWLINYQIKVAELKGRYTPYEVLSWVANDWRKENERSDKQTGGDCIGEQPKRRSAR